MRKFVLLAAGLLALGLTGCTQIDQLWQSIEPAPDSTLEDAQLDTGLHLAPTVLETPEDPYKDDTTLVKEDCTADGIRYAVYERHAEITGHNDKFSVTELIVPDELDGKPVTRIASVSITSEGNLFEADKNGAFYGCYALEKVTLPAQLTYIGDYAFYSCKNLSKIEIPGSVTEIGTRAFALCSKLKECSIPAAIGHVGTGAFSLTPWYDALRFQSDLVIFNGKLYDAGRQCSGVVEVPEHVTEVCDQAFFACPDVQAVRLPESVKRIGVQAFCECPKLEQVSIANPDCEIDDDLLTFTTKEQRGLTLFWGTIYGTEGSTAQKYAERYEKKFQLIGTEPTVTAPARQTTAPLTEPAGTTGTTTAGATETE